MSWQNFEMYLKVNGHIDDILPGNILVFYFYIVIIVKGYKHLRAQYGHYG